MKTRAQRALGGIAEVQGRGRHELHIFFHSCLPPQASTARVKKKLINGETAIHTITMVPMLLVNFKKQVLGLF